MRRVLGRPHALTGPVVHGDKLGRTIGFPTANVEPVAEMLPPDGIYAVRGRGEPPGHGRAFRSRRMGGGAMSIGVRPTVTNTGRRTVETYVLGFEGDLYGAEIRLEVIARLREELRFTSLEELKVQMAQDVEEAKARLGSG